MLESIKQLVIRLMDTCVWALFWGLERSPLSSATLSIGVLHEKRTLRSVGIMWGIQIRHTN